MTNTNEQYDAVIKGCKDIFIKKSSDYGTSWRVLRPISIADQIYIKAKRIRTIQEGGQQKVPDDIMDEFRGIINYSVIGLIQLQLGNDAIDEIPVAEVSKLYDEQVAITKSLMQSKNHDYGEAWRDMSQEGLTDLILQKLYRMKQIIRNDGKTIISEGLDANYMDMLNYAVFALILAEET
jgi:Nucleotide modification associated domain 1